MRLELCKKKLFECQGKRFIVRVGNPGRWVPDSNEFGFPPLLLAFVNKRGGEPWTVPLGIVWITLYQIPLITVANMRYCHENKLYMCHDNLIYLTLFPEERFTAPSLNAPSHLFYWQIPLKEGERWEGGCNPFPWKYRVRIIQIVFHFFNWPV